MKENKELLTAYQWGGVVLFSLILLFLPPVDSIRADDSPSGHFTESFSNYEYADGARTTAWWDRSGERLTLRPPDAGHIRRWPALTATPDGGMMVIWVEERGTGPHIWAQKLDAHGNRLWGEDVTLVAWNGEWPEAASGAHRLALTRLGIDDYRLVWSDADGVWTRTWSETGGWGGETLKLTETSSDRVSLRCWEVNCAIIWQENDQSQLRLLNDAGRQSMTIPGKAYADWYSETELWLAWGDGESEAIQRYDSQLNPRWVPPLYAPGGHGGVADIAAFGGNLFLLYLDPLFVFAVSGEPPTSAGILEQAISQSVASSALWGVASGRLVMVWQTPEPFALWMCWLDGDSFTSEETLLRLGFPGSEPILGDVAMTADGAVAVAWTEGAQVFARKWWKGGGSPWRHEVTPAYSPVPGWVVSEGLGHSLAVNQPWEAVTAVKLETTATTNGGTVQFYVSNQGPRAWRQIEPGQTVTFSAPGTELRWYARLRRSPWGTAPEVREVSLDYTYEWLQHLPLSQLRHHR